MDYRKPVVFGQNWSASRYKVLPYFAAEQRYIVQSGAECILDLGCANGWNMSRFSQYGRRAFGLDLEPERVRLALAHGPVTIASGLQIPVAADTFDVVYIQHVLHHIGDVRQALQEARRVLRPGGMLFLVETTEDSPLIRWGRRLHPSWMGDEINAPFLFDSLQALLHEAGFAVLEQLQYSVIFWVWETLPDQLPFAEKLTTLFVALEQVAVRLLRRQSSHCYLVAQK
jgi:SAM-dependent methyltransferase